MVSPNPEEKQESAVDPRDCLYISDLDGTLLTPDSALPEESVRRLNRLIGRGLKFTIATARNYDSAYPLLKNVDFRIPVILFNGVYLTDFHTGKNVVLSSFIGPETVADLMAMILPCGIDPFVYAYGGGHKVYFREAVNAGSKNYLNSLDGDGRLQYMKQYEFDGAENISGLLLIDSHAALEPIHRELSRKFHGRLNMYFAEDIAMPGFYWLQIFHQHANKGRMVERLARHLNTPLSRVVVFGDYLNDLDMFRIAGKAVAVGNALPEVKTAAHEVIGTNESRAVIEYLESLEFPAESTNS